MDQSDLPVICVVTVGEDEDQCNAAAELRRRLVARGFAPVVMDVLAVLPILTRGLTRAVAADRQVARALARSPVPRAAATVATHPLAARVLGWMRRAGHLRTPVVTYIGHLRVDRSWLTPGIDLHLTLHVSAAAQIRVARADRVAVVAALVDEQYRPAVTPAQRAAARTRLGILGGESIPLLIGATAADDRRVEHAARHLARVGIRPVVATGNNDVLRARLIRDGVGLAIPHTPGLLPTLLRACDLAVTTRPGGTALQALASGLAVLVYQPRSAAVRAETQAWRDARWATPVDSPHQLAEMVGQALREPDGDRPRLSGPDPASIVAALAGPVPGEPPPTG